MNTTIDFSKLKRRKTPVKESTVVLFGRINEEEIKTSINKVAITGRKVKLTPRIKEYEVAFPGDKGATMGMGY